VDLESEMEGTQNTCPARSVLRARVTGSVMIIVGCGTQEAEERETLFAFCVRVGDTETQRRRDAEERGVDEEEEEQEKRKKNRRKGRR
jgi:hypothetical protein